VKSITRIVGMIVVRMRSETGIYHLECCSDAWVDISQHLATNIKKPPWPNGINSWVGHGTPPQLGCPGSSPGASSPLPTQLGAEGFAFVALV
jgi:hypothetical protein